MNVQAVTKLNPLYRVKKIHYPPHRVNENPARVRWTSRHTRRNQPPDTDWLRLKHSKRSKMGKLRKISCDNKSLGAHPSL